MKRRNADIGKLRRPIKRTKITEGMYGNSMLYVKFILLWSSIALADYMLEFRFEFLWPLWLMIKAIYHCYQCKGLAFTVFFTCIAVTSDMICYFFIPMQMLTYLAGVYVWVNSIWNTFESKGVCAQTIAMWLLVVYAEALRTGVISAALSGSLAEEPDEWASKPWAASALGFPIVSLGVGVKTMLDEKLRIRTQRQVREQNEFYFRLMREAIPEGGLTSSTYTAELLGETEGGGEVKQNGAACAGAGKRRWKPDTNGHCVRDKEHASLQAKLEHLEQYVERKNRARDSSTQSTQSQKSSQNSNSTSNSVHTSVQSSTQPSPHAGHANGSAKGAGCPAEDKHNHWKGGAKSTKYDKKEATTLKEERRRKKNRDIDKEIIDSHKSTVHTKEQIDKDIESTKECVKVKECNNIHKEDEKRRDEERKREREEERKREEVRRREREDEKKREKERERELKEREKEKERERERELLLARECAEEVSRLKSALAISQRNEAESARQVAAALAAEKQRRASQAELKQQLQHKMSTWRCGERAALDRKLGEERRLRLAAEHQLLKVRRTPQGECESEWCKSRRCVAEAEAVTLRKDLQRARDRLTQSQRELNEANEQVALLEAEKSAAVAVAPPPGHGAGPAGVVSALQARVAHLDHVLSSETRVKLDLLSALGDANRKMHIQESIINRQEKQLEELKAQMLAVMPAEYVCPSVSAVSKMRLSEGSPLDPNATVYTPKQLCSDA